MLAQLDPAIYQVRVIQVRGNLANAEANLRNLEASIAAMQAVVETNQANIARLKAAVDARANAQRVANLAKAGVLSQDQNDMMM